MTEVRILDDGGDGLRAVDIGGGCITPILLKSPAETKEIIEKMPELKCRDDDIMMCTFAKTGTNWCFELITMILKRSAERFKENKVMTMLETVSEEELDLLPSPRVLNTHHLPKFLPKDLEAKQIKTVLCLRNPKDTAVSYYNHMTGINSYEYNGKWENWLRPFAEGKFEYGLYAAYLNDYQDLIERGPGFPLHVMYFEDLKTNCLGELNKLAKFLEVELDDNMKEDIVKMCHFDKMSADKNIDSGSIFFKADFKFFRKGKSGDWKNWFTVAQNEMFDAAWKRDIRKDSMFKFRYTLD